MQFLLELNQRKAYGQIPVIGTHGKIMYIIRGNLDNPNHTLYLYDTKNHEVGRLFRDRGGIIVSFIVDVIKKNPTAGAVSICPAVNAIPRANTISIMHITTSKFKKYSILRIICLAISKIIERLP